MDEFGIMESTHDIPAMSTDELRATVFRPWRFARDMRLGRFDRLHLTRILAPPDVYVMAAKLLPGGRWLVSLEHDTVSDARRLRIYDMSLRGDEIHAVGDLEVHVHRATSYMEVQPKTEFGAQSGALIFLNQWILDDHLGKLQVFSLEVGRDSEPSLVLHKEQATGVDLYEPDTWCRSTGSALVYKRWGKLLIWYWRQDEWAWVTLGDDMRNFLPIALHGDTLLLVDGDQVHQVVSLNLRGLVRRVGVIEDSPPTGVTSSFTVTGRWETFGVGGLRCTRLPATVGPSWLSGTQSWALRYPGLTIVVDVELPADDAAKVTFHRHPGNSDEGNRYWSEGRHRHEFCTVEAEHHLVTLFGNGRLEVLRMNDQGQSVQDAQILPDLDIPPHGYMGRGFACVISGIIGLAWGGDGSFLWTYGGQRYPAEVRLSAMA
ncbi:hypothetical protein FS837_000799 [Tulasnella sp. UAMH 9824]|nr:hypothetical protein FS837_000799 [Tulasnella sp. UAMH 9824]